VSEQEVSAYIEAQDEPKRNTLQAMRQSILEIEPRLEQSFAWKSAMFKFNGKFVAGLCAHKAHISYSPQSAEVMTALADDLAEFVVSKSSFQVASDAPLPKQLLTKLVKARIAEIEAK
jgi:uncharacterized protein YdhG (YjbR/CyaY superfamily)